MPKKANYVCVNTNERCFRRQRRPTAFQVSWMVRLGLLCSVTLVSLALPVKAQWTAPDFEVIPVDPWEKIAAANNGDIPQNSSFPAPSQLRAQTKQSPLGGTQAVVFQLATAAEAALKNAASIYAQVGFKEPIFGPMVNPTKRGVFMYPAPGTAEDEKVNGEYFSATCDKKKRFSQDWLMLSQKLSGEDLFSTPAHELFHAIQAQYPFSTHSNGEKRCRSFGWIDEGTADAAAQFLLARKLQGPLPNDLDFYGLRPYDVPLYEDLDAWNMKAIKSRFTIKPSQDFDETVSYRTSSFWRFLMDRFDNFPQFDPKRLRVLATFMSHTAPANTHSAWLDWTAKRIHNVWGAAFSHMYGQFLSEYAAWPGSKYPQYPPKQWLYGSFGNCEKVTLSPGKKSAKPPILLKPRKGAKHALYPISGRCIQVTVKGFKGKKVKLSLEAEVEPIKGKNINEDEVIETPSKKLADQLLLGFAREESGNGKKGMLIKNCYRLARKKPNNQFPCVYKGKVNPKKSNDNTVHSWRFQPRIVKHSTFTRTFILTNVDPTTASETQGIPHVKVRIALLVFDGKTQKWTRFDPPEKFNLGQLPDVNIPRRQTLYGITKKSAVSTGYSMGLSPIQVVALDEAGKKKETYSISPIEPVAFGQTGPFKAMVMLGSGDMSTGTIGSQFCQPSSQPGQIGEITQSDDEVLEISIDTPLCQLSISNIAACENGCPVVDHFQGELTLPFGWRHFTETVTDDLVTPGVLLDIDRYHHEVFGTPLQGLSGLGSGGGSGGGGAGGSGSEGSGGNPGGSSQGGTITPPCDCSCEAYEKLRNTKNEKVPDFEFLGNMMQCTQQCAKPFRDCRRAQKIR